jgi:myosin heavy subunit
MLSEQNTLKQTVSALVARCDTEFQEQIPRADLQKMLKEHTEIMEIQEEMLDKQDSFNEKQNKFTKDQAELRKIQDTHKTHLELLSNQYKVMDSSWQKISTNLQKIEADLRSLEKNVQAIQLEQKALQDVQENILKEQRNVQTVQEKLLAEQKSVQDGMEKIKQANGQLFSSIQENQDVISDVQNTSKSQFEHLKQMTTKLHEKVTSDHDKFSADFLQAHEWCKQIEADQSRNAFQRNAERIKLSSTVDGLKVELDNVLGKISEVREEQEKIQDSVRKLCKSDWKRFKMAMESSTASESRALVYYSNDMELTNADTASFRSIQYNVDTTEAIDENPPFDDSMAAGPFMDESNDAEYRSVMNMFEDIDEERDSPETPDNEEPSSYNEPGQEAGKDKSESTGFFFEADFSRDVKPVLKRTLVRENLTKDGRSIVACHGTEPSEVCTVDIEDDILLTEQVLTKSSDVAQSKE